MYNLFMNKSSFDSNTKALLKAGEHECHFTKTKNLLDKVKVAIRFFIKVKVNEREVFLNFHTLSDMVNLYSRDIEKGFNVEPFLRVPFILENTERVISDNLTRLKIRDFARSSVDHYVHEHLSLEGILDTPDDFVSKHIDIKFNPESHDLVYMDITLSCKEDEFNIIHLLAKARPEVFSDDLSHLFGIDNGKLVTKIDFINTNNPILDFLIV